MKQGLILQRYEAFFGDQKIERVITVKIYPEGKGFSSIHMDSIGYRWVPSDRIGTDTVEYEQIWIDSFSDLTEPMKDYLVETDCYGFFKNIEAFRLFLKWVVRSEILEEVWLEE